MKSLSFRYIFIFLIILVVPVFLAGAFLDQRYYRQLKDSALAKNQELTDQISSSLNSEISQIQILCAGLINNLDFLSSCKSYVSAENPEDYHISSREIEAHLISFFRYTNKIGAICLYFSEESPVYYQNYPVTSPPDFNSAPFLRSALETPGVNQVIPELFSVNSAENGSPLLSIAVSPSPTNSRNGLKVLLMSFRIPLMDRIVSANTDDDITVLTDQNGRVILTGSPEVPADFREQSESGVNLPVMPGKSQGTHLITFSLIESTGWTLYRFLNYESFIRPLLRYRSAAYIFFVFLLMIFIVYTFVFFRGLLSPLQTIIRQMSIVESGDYSVQVPVEGHGEMAHLGMAFNSMTFEIRRLTAENQAREAEKNRYEMEALQYQIHPHFVANTLNSIRIMADTGGASHIADMSSSLMRLITESFNKGGRLISLKDERINLESYIHIMNVRFGELIILQFDIPEDFLNQQILKMMLQPLVENAVLHGIRENGRAGAEPDIIRLSARLENDTLCIEIRDNGKGMPRETLRGILCSPAKRQSRGFSGIGVYNVHRRIQLNYGDDFGLSVQSTEDSGTTVRLRVPAWQKSGD